MSRDSADEVDDVTSGRFTPAASVAPRSARTSTARTTRTGEIGAAAYGRAVIAGLLLPRVQPAHHLAHFAADLLDHVFGASAAQRAEVRLAGLVL